MAAQQRRGESDGEAVAVAREIEHRAAGGQPLGERDRVGKEAPARDRAVPARVANARVEVTLGDERRFQSWGTPRSA